MDRSGGLAGCTVFASLAKKNFESSLLFCAGLFEYPISDAAGLNETVGRFGRSLSIPLIPNPDPYTGGSRFVRNDSLDTEAGVPVGVPVGVVFVLSTRLLRDDDRGVMLLFRNVDTGVDRSSFDDTLGEVISGRAPLRDNGV